MGIGMRVAIAASFVALSLSFPTLRAWATEWSEPVARPDPFSEGATCDVSSPVSYGSYIYHWPEKYDQAFWPLTDRHAIVVCPESGYVSYFFNFQIEEANRPAVAAYLAGESMPSGDGFALLPRLIKLTELRGSPPIATNRVLRAVAFMYESAGRYDAASTYRKRALEGLPALFDDADLDLVTRIELLAVTAAYEREFGNTRASNRALRQLSRALSTIPAKDMLSDRIDADSDDDGVADLDTEEAKALESLVASKEYFTELQSDIRRIKPGGRLAPEE